MRAHLEAFNIIGHPFVMRRDTPEFKVLIRTLAWIDGAYILSQEVANWYVLMLFRFVARSFGED